MKYNNPVISGFYPDPSVCRVGGDYYLVNSSFAYFPGIPIWHSKDLMHWRQIGYCLTRENQLPLEKSVVSGGVWAPTLRYHNGMFYMVTTNEDYGGHFYVWTNDPAGEWSDPIFVDQEGIDPSLFFDEDGKVYFTSTGNESGMGIYQCEIDIINGTKRSESRLIWTGTGGKFPEGPHLYKRDGYYYLMCAEGGTEYGHMETIARGTTPYGPFETGPRNPILSHRSLGHPIQATGHADLVEAHDGSWWAVFLGIRPVGYPNRHHLGRETFLAPVRWSEDGWPMIGNNGTVELEIEADTLPTMLWDNAPETDHFDEPDLKMHWNFLRSGQKVVWSLIERTGWLALHGCSVRLCERGTPAMIARRQQQWACDVSVRMEYNPEEGDEAGLTVFMDDRHHFEIGLTRIEGNQVVTLKRQVGSIQDEKCSLPFEGTVINLRIKAFPEKYMFYYEGADREWNLLGEAETYLVSTEVAGGFTGVFFGMYNYSANGTTAYFDWFHYK
ncbi:glycoside hydrolase family 43 protein [Paenibacillus donghaensis]|uniref:Glycoside hydrolase 43 family protein n=1 Tax=Paenibacillus donghaensis TaxID=414771 RepID=A0A2Z2KLT3_9BACL|nr:glycoside hydrolase family 43 protein [Paenibacillus donghaensis]ASA23459.1 glycoside hydrolase 43 family protein [Paenibacillus donghaensis]